MLLWTQFHEHRWGLHFSGFIFIVFGRLHKKHSKHHWYTTHTHTHTHNTHTHTHTHTHTISLPFFLHSCPPPSPHSTNSTDIEADISNTTFEEAIGAISPMVESWFIIVLYFFGAIHLFFSLWMLTEYFLINLKNFVLPRFVYIPFERWVCLWPCICCLYVVCAKIHGLTLPLYLFSWYTPPDKTYSDVNIFGLQTVYVVVRICTSWL